MKKTNLLLLLCLLAIASYTQPPAGATRAERLRYYYLNPDDGVNKDRVWIMAHRGAWDEESPESSIQSFINAVTYRFEILELDVRFSAPYDKSVDNVQILNPKGKHREIILEHDKSNERSNYIINSSGDTIWSKIYGLYKFDVPLQHFDPKITMKTSTQSKLPFIMLDKLVPFRADGNNCIDGPGGAHPILLKLDGTESTSRMVHFPHRSSYEIGNIYYNPDFYNFYTAVKDNILLNFDKLSSPRDFQETYDIMNHNDLLRQCIFKAKNVTGFAAVQNLFTPSKDLSEVMFTPIFTRYDFDGADPNSVTGAKYTNAKKLSMAKDCVNSLLAADNAGHIKFAGCEIVYEKLDPNDPDVGWLTALADYVKNTLHKRIVQFSTNVENKLGAWSGNGNFWSNVQGVDVNYWSWLFNNPNVNGAHILPDVFVGDKPLEFRSYLNSLGKYNVTPIQ